MTGAPIISLRKPEGSRDSAAEAAAPLVGGEGAADMFGLLACFAFFRIGGGGVWLVKVR